MILSRFRSLWDGIRGRAAVDDEMSEEFRLHIDMRTEDLMRRGVAPDEARRQARMEFGSADEYKAQATSARGLKRFDDLRLSWLDFKLGFRMLVKYPGLTFVGGLAIAFAVAVGASAFEFITQVLHPTIRLADGDRIVGIHNRDGPRRLNRQALFDFTIWRSEVKSVVDLGAFRWLERNLITDDGRAEPVDVAEMTASGFRVARVHPLMGRALVDADERPGAPDVIVIGHDEWKQRFGGDPRVLGRTVRVGDTRSTIVGVMPAGFAFPIAFSYWTPLRPQALNHEPGEGPEIYVFGRLTPGKSLKEAQAELNAIATRFAADHPKTHGRLRPEIMPHAESVWFVPDPDALGLMAINVFLVMLLVLVFGNVALLVFARAATRESEVVVRTALGASRRRIITQLFAEAVVLGSAGALVGLAGAGAALGWGLRVMGLDRRLPFWFHSDLFTGAIVYAIGLTLVSALIAGVVPGLKLTRGLETRLRQVGAGGGGLRFGGVWTAVIVLQVAVTVTFPVTAFFTRRDAVQVRSLDVGFASREYLVARLDLEASAEPGLSPDSAWARRKLRLRESGDGLQKRLLGEAGVLGVTFANLLPSMDHPQRRIEVEGLASPDSASKPSISTVSVAPNFFDVLGAPPLLGRGFHAGDVGRAARAVIVNRSFVRVVLHGANPIGRRVRYADPENGDPRLPGWQPGPWYEIVGVVKDLGATDGSDPIESGAAVYHAVSPSDLVETRMLVHVTGDPASFAQRLRSVATTVDPALRVGRAIPLDEVQRSNLQVIGFWFRVLVVVSTIALSLSLAGIYAVMSFTVARRTREIGIRVALGSDRRHLVLAIFKRPLTQVGLGVLAGGVLVAFFAVMILGTPSAMEVALLVGYALLMLFVCMLACIVPTRRAMAVQPTDALRSE